VSPEQNPNFFPKQSERGLIARTERVVALNLSVRSDCVVMRRNAPRTRSRTRVCKNQKISLHFSRVSSPHPSTAKRKRNGKEIFGFASPFQLRKLRSSSIIKIQGVHTLYYIPYIKIHNISYEHCE